MTQLDIFYRSYENYKKELLNNREDHLFKKAAYSKNKPQDFISKISVECYIHDDWISAIEKAVPYLEKCIKEDRQFIRNEGEVLPIEKIRRVSKDSVSDLAKHSDYITKIPEDDKDVIPEKLLMITRESDYKIYENRVLYATLTYLRDFISTRLEKIVEAINKYEGKFFIKKKVEVHNRTLDFLMDVSEKRLEDPIAVKNSKCARQIERIKLELNDILVLLKTPLMIECSKAALVKRPITKTNVLKMNTNFKEALAIFDYAVEYPGPGYEIEEKELKIYPLSESQTNAFSDIIQLSSFLAYMYNNHLEDDLLTEYEAEEERRRKASEDELLAKMEEMYNKAKSSGRDLKEYIFLLEEGTRILKERIEETKQEMAKLIEEQELRLINIANKHKEEIEQIYREFDEKLADEQARCNEKIRQIQVENDQYVSYLNSEHAKAIEAINDELNQQKAINTQLKSFVEQANAEVEQIKVAAQEEVTRIHKEATKSIELAQAETLALRLKTSKPPLPKEFVSKDRYEQLEAEIKTLTEFQKGAWKEAKIEIRNNYFKQIKSKEPIAKPTKKAKKHVEVTIELVEDSKGKQIQEPKKFFEFTPSVPTEEVSKKEE